MKIKIGWTEIDTEDNNAVYDELLQSAVDHVKANKAAFTENAEYKDISKVLENKVE